MPADTRRLYRPGQASPPAPRPAGSASREHYGAARRFLQLHCGPAFLIYFPVYATITMVALLTVTAASAAVALVGAVSAAAVVFPAADRVCGAAGTAAAALVTPISAAASAAGAPSVAEAVSAAALCGEAPTRAVGAVRWAAAVVAVGLGGYLGVWVLLVDRRWRRAGGRWIGMCRWHPFFPLLREYFSAEVFFDPSELPAHPVSGRPASPPGSASSACAPSNAGGRPPALVFLDGYTGSCGHARSGTIADADLARLAARAFPGLVHCDEALAAEVAAGERQPPFAGRYLMGIHPHGLFALTCWTSFCAVGRATSLLSRLFLNGHPAGTVVPPGCGSACGDGRRRFSVVVHTLSLNFWLPVWREFLMWAGLQDASRASLISGLRALRPSQKKPAAASCQSKKKAAASPPAAGAAGRVRLGPHGTGHLAVLVPGGAAESVDAANLAVLTLRSRKGFVKLALEQGAATVPAYAFGENHTYFNVSDHPALFAFLRRLQKWLGVGIPPVAARWTLGLLLPLRVPLTLVIGAPLRPEDLLAGFDGAAGACATDASGRRSWRASPAAVDHAHAVYVGALQRLYSRNRLRFDPEGPRELTIS